MIVGFVKLVHGADCAKHLKTKLQEESCMVCPSQLHTTFTDLHLQDLFMAAPTKSAELTKPSILIIGFHENPFLFHLLFPFITLGSLISNGRQTPDHHYVSSHLIIYIYFRYCQLIETDILTFYDLTQWWPVLRGLLTRGLCQTQSLISPTW